MNNIIEPYKIIELVEKEHHVKTTLRTRKKPIMYARHQCIFLIRKHCGLTLKQIMEYFPISDHATIISSLRRSKKLMQTDINFHARLNKLDNELTKYAKDNTIQTHKRGRQA